jgi:L-ascorbate metabolism protein UlaG (beta-lactamase superfamily)
MCVQSSPHSATFASSAPMLRVIFLLTFSAQALVAGLARYSSFVVADMSNQAVRSDGVRVTYLGTNGYQFESAGHALLVDPYFSRISLERVAFGWPVRPDLPQIDKGLAHVAPTADAILVTHGHFDHLLDAPIIMRKAHARLIASPTAVELANRAGAVRTSCDPVVAGNTRKIGPWKITVFPATHDRVLLIGVPFQGPLRNGPPRHAADWVCGEPLSYLIEVNGIRIFIDSGGTPSMLPSPEVAPVDLAILGVALPDSRARFAEAVRRLRPRYVLPSHQDNFFRPLRDGFQFGTLTDFPFVRQEHGRQHLPGRLILLDYFRPWTIPRK